MDPSFGSRLVEKLGSSLPDEQKDLLRKKADELYNEDGTFLATLRREVKAAAGAELSEDVEAAYKQHLDETAASRTKAELLDALKILSAAIGKEAGCPEEIREQLTTKADMCSVRLEMAAPGRIRKELLAEVASLAASVAAAGSGLSDEAKQMGEKLTNLAAVAPVKTRDDIV